jgi:hypothetical protein
MKKGREVPGPFLLALLDVALTLHWSLPSCLGCSDHIIVSFISFVRLKSLHPG